MVKVAPNSLGSKRLPPSLRSRTNAGLIRAANSCNLTQTPISHAHFLQLNNLAIYRDQAAAEFFYFHLFKEEQRASHCEECGHCEERCPQHIPIPDGLKEVVQEFESRGA
jgi:predicted aldo/keto reductase-like oxidoreductase